MATPLEQKSTVAEIQERFDRDVDRFADLSTGQAATLDAPLVMDLIAQAAVRTTPEFQHVLDIGCGAGNNTLKLREITPRDFAVDLLDLSQPMLERARQRVAAANRGSIVTIQHDFRNANLVDNAYDIVIAAAVLHHLRDDADWETTFAKLYRIVRPGGSIWITDLVSHEISAVRAMMWERYGAYLSSLGGDAYRDQVFAYIDREDSPRPVTYQLNLLQRVGFHRVELLHKNTTFAAFGAVKRG